MPVTFSNQDKSTPATDKPDASAASSTQEKFVFYECLRSHEPTAIRQLAKRVNDYLSSLSASSGISSEEREEFVSDAVFITLNNIGNGKFEFRDADPTTYAITVLRNLVGNLLQKKRIKTIPLDLLDRQLISNFDSEKYIHDKEREKNLESLLNKLGEPCRELILLRYYEEISDEEAIKQKRTSYSNADSLKTQRSKCLQKLKKLVLKHRNLFH